MRASDLRIGNYISILDRNPECWGIIATVEDKLNDNPYCQPIELTVDWLKKFGFTLVFVKGEFNIWSNDVFTITELYSFGTFVWFINDNESVGIYYVHELQNLYFAITKEDLIIK